jgi:hypothetical protein
MDGSALAPPSIFCFSCTSKYRDRWAETVDPSSADSGYIGPDLAVFASQMVHKTGIQLEFELSS